jgi:hypothetical protein
MRHFKQRKRNTREDCQELLLIVAEKSTDLIAKVILDTFEQYKKIRKIMR